MKAATSEQPGLQICTGDRTGVNECCFTHFNATFAPSLPAAASFTPPRFLPFTLDFRSRAVLAVYTGTGRGGWINRHGQRLLWLFDAKLSCFG